MYQYDSYTAHEIVTRLTYIAAGHVSTWYTWTPPFGGCNPSSGYVRYLIADDDDGDITNGTPHMRAIYQAFNENEIACSSPEVLDSGCMDKPLDAPIVISEPGKHKISLIWNEVEGATSYEVFRSDGPNGCDGGKVKLTETSLAFYEDSRLQDGREYYYVVIPKSGGSCFGPASQCVTETPKAMRGVTLACSDETVILNLLHEEPIAEVTCLVETTSDFRGTVAFGCSSEIGSVACSIDRTSTRFTINHSSEHVTLSLSAMEKIEGKGRVEVSWTFGNDRKMITYVPIRVARYGEYRSAQYIHSNYLAPFCQVPGRVCSSESLLNGRGISMGPEQNAPNAIRGSCPDGRSGTYKVDESIEKIVVRSGGLEDEASDNLTEGQEATIEVTVYAYGSGMSDTADIWHSTDPNNAGTWTWVESIVPPNGGLVTLKSTITIPYGAPVQAVRVNCKLACVRMLSTFEFTEMFLQIAIEETGRLALAEITTRSM